MAVKVKIPARVQFEIPAIAKPMAAKKQKAAASVNTISAPYPVGVSTTFDPLVSIDQSESEGDTSEAEMEVSYESVTKSEDESFEETLDKNIEEYARNSASISILNSNRNLIWPEFQIENCRTESSFGHFVVPIITLGTWDHPYYGEVKFSQADVDELSNNFDNRAAGYEPALYVGHGSPFDGGGRPAAGFLEVLVQNEDVLWGVYAAVNEEVYMQVKKGQYRYSSAELTQETVHRQSGDKLGLVLTGCALTNEPFLTNMPPVRVFSNSQSTQQPLSIAYALNHHHSCVQDRSDPVIGNWSMVGEPTKGNPTRSGSTAVNTDSTRCGSPATPSIPVIETDTSITMSTVSTPSESKVESSLELSDRQIERPRADNTPVASTVESLTINTTLLAISAELKDLKSEFSTMKAQVVELSAANESLVLSRAAEIKERQFTTVREATLSAGAKQAFMTALSSPTIDPDTAAALIVQVKELSNTEAGTYLTQHGASGAPAELELLGGSPAQPSAAPNVTTKQEFAYGAYLADRAARMSAK